nr:sulfite exporter TauE/SafE family protein [Clostridia bacterium]
VAMCGGINLSQCIPQNEAREQGKLSALRPTFLYNLGRVISYTVVGFIVGAIGSAITFSNTLQGILKLIAGVFMIIMGINMLGIFPWLKKLNPRMPGFLSRKITAEKSRSKSPLIVGLLNGLMPCGPLQAMQIYALSTGSPFAGALSMLVFSLGTVPLMFGLGALSTILSKKFTRRMMTVGAVLVAVLGLAMFSQGWSLSGFNLPEPVSQNANGAQSETDTDGTPQVETNDGTHVVNSPLSSGGYPAITVQAGTPVKWVIDAPEGSINGCNNRMILREYDIEYRFKTGENVITFTPTETGKFQYTCWMGMIRGTITVVEAGTNSSSANAATPSAAPATSTPAVYTIPTDNVAVATRGKDQDGNDMQTVEITLTEEGFSPAIVVVERGSYVEWKIRNQASDTAELMVPLYSTSLPLDQEENSFPFFPDGSFDFSTGDNTFYGYVKVVDDLDAVNIDAIKAEVAAYVPSASSQDGFTGGGGGCCG